LRFLPKGGPWGRLVLDAAVGGEPGPVHALNAAAADAPSGEALVGRSGVAVTALFPSGQVEIGGRRYEAKLGMGFADAGTSVRVTGVSEFCLTVEVMS
jgi:membrane-bound serine protease (ClpP class)